MRNEPKEYTRADITKGFKGALVLAFLAGYILMLYLLLFWIAV